VIGGVVEVARSGTGEPPVPDGAGVGGGPGEQALYPSLRSTDEARRVWEWTQELTRVPFPR